MSPRVMAILIGLFVVLAAGGVMLIPSGNGDAAGNAPGMLAQGDRGVPGRTGGRGSGLMMNQGSRTVAAPVRPAPSAQERTDGSGPGFQSGDRQRRAAVPDRSVSEASGEAISPAERARAQTINRPQATPSRGGVPAADGSGVDRAAAVRNAEIARAQAIRDARQRAQMAQRNLSAVQRAAGRQNADQTGAAAQGLESSGDGTRTTGGTGAGTGSGGTGPATGGNAGAGSGAAGSSSGGRGPAGGGQAGGGATSGSGSGGSGSGGSGGSGGGPIIGGVPNVTVTAEFRQVAIDTTACPDLVGHRTVDLFLVFSQPVGVLTVDSSGVDRLRVVGGSLVQVPGGGNGPPNAGLVAGSPCIAFDSYFDLGGVPLSFAAGPSFGGTTNQTITATWFSIAPAQTTLRSGQHELRVARFTAPTTITDITGSLGVGYTVVGLQGAPSVQVALPSVASVFTGEPPPAGGGVDPPDGEEPVEPEEREEPVDLFGACCFPAAVCQGDLTASDCAVLGGVYQGDGTSCASVNCPAGPGTDPPGGGGGTPPGGGGGGGTPEPGDDPDRPIDDPEDPRDPEEPEEPLGITGFWLAVNNDGAVCSPGFPDIPSDLSAANTFDLYLRMDAPHRLLLVESNPATAHLLIQGGSVFHHPGGNNLAPNPNLFEVFPCLAFDSYLAFEDVAMPIAAPQPSAPSIIGLTASGGVGALSETTWTGALGALWFLTPPPSILAEQNPGLFGDDLYYVRIGRFTLPSGVSVGGSLNASITVAGSGQANSVTAIPVPTVSGP